MINAAFTLAFAALAALAGFAAFTVRSPFNGALLALLAGCALAAVLIELYAKPPR